MPRHKRLLTNRQAAILGALDKKPTGQTSRQVLQAIHGSTSGRGRSAGITATLMAFARRGWVTESPLMSSWAISPTGKNVLWRFLRPRPSLTDDDVIAAARDALAPRIEGWLKREMTNPEKELLVPHTDGYILATRFADRERQRATGGQRWEPNAELVALLDETHSAFISACDEACRRWISETGQAPALKVGDRTIVWSRGLLGPHRCRLMAAVITQTHREGRYTVYIPELKAERGQVADDVRILSWEDVDPLHALFEDSHTWSGGARTATAWGIQQVNGEPLIHFSWSAPDGSFAPPTTTTSWPPLRNLNPDQPPWPWGARAPEMPRSVEVLLCPETEVIFSHENPNQTVML